MDQFALRTDATHPALLPVIAFASADGHEYQVLEGDDGRLVVTVDGELPYSFSAGQNNEEKSYDDGDEKRPARGHINVPADDAN